MIKPIHLCWWTKPRFIPSFLPFVPPHSCIEVEWGKEGLKVSQKLLEGAKFVRAVPCLFSLWRMSTLGPRIYPLSFLLPCLFLLFLLFFFSHFSFPSFPFLPSCTNFSVDRQGANGENKTCSPSCSVPTFKCTRAYVEYVRWARGEKKSLSFRWGRKAFEVTSWNCMVTIFSSLLHWHAPCPWRFWAENTAWSEE